MANLRRFNPDHQSVSVIGVVVQDVNQIGIAGKRTVGCLDLSSLILKVRFDIQVVESMSRFIWWTDLLTT